MRCPKCQSTNNVATQTRRCTIRESQDAFKRTRICRDCGAQWATTERIDKYDFDLQEWTGHVALEPEPELPVVPKPAPRPQRIKPAVFHPVSIDEVAGIVVGIPADVCLLLCEWWNNSRRSKHGTAAAWTERAFTMSVERVKKLPHGQQHMLVNAGIEHGWQSLNPSYCKELLAQQQQQQQRHGGFRPQSSGLAGALAIIQGGGDGSS